MQELNKAIINRARNCIKDINYRIFWKKNELFKFQELLLKAKYSLKKTKTIHWQHKELREDQEFKRLCLSTEMIYKDIKKNFQMIEESIKREKLLLKTEQRRISTYSKKD